MFLAILVDMHLQSWFYCGSCVSKSELMEVTTQII